MNKKVSTILTCGLILGGSLLSSSAFAEAGDIIPIQNAEAGKTYALISTHYWDGTQYVDRTVNDETNPDGNKYITYDVKTKKYVLGAKKNALAFSVSSTGATVAARSYTFTSAQGVLSFSDVNGKNGSSEFSAIVKGQNGSLGDFSALVWEKEVDKVNTSFEVGDGGNASNPLYGITNSGTGIQGFQLMEIEAGDVSDEDLNAFFNTKGFNLEVNGEDVQGNLFGGDSRVWAFQVSKNTCEKANWDKDKGYKVSEKDHNGKDLYIPAGIYFFTDRVLNDDCDPSKGISAEDIDWLESTFIAVSVKETVENTVPDRGNGQGFKLVPVKGSEFIFVDNTSKVAVGDMPINNACFTAYDNHAANDKYPYALELGSFYYQAKSTDKDTDDAANAKVQIGVLPFDNESVQWLTTITKETTEHQYAFRFGNSAAVDGIDLLKTTKEAAVYTIKFVAGNESDEELIGKYLTVGVDTGTNDIWENDGDDFEWIAKGSMIANTNHPAFQYTITAVDDETGKLITFTNRETNKSFTAQLFPEEGTNRYSIALEDKNLNGKIDNNESMSVMPLDVNLNSYAVEKAENSAILIDEDVIIELTPVTPDEYAGFYNVDNESVRTIRFARDKNDTSYKWYAGVLQDKNDKDKYSLQQSILGQSVDYFVEDVYDAAQWQLIKAEKPNTIARTFVYNNTTTESIDDVPNGDKVSAYQYVLRYINDGTPTNWYLNNNDKVAKTDDFKDYDKKKDFDELTGAHKFYIKENADGSVSLFDTDDAFGEGSSDDKQVTIHNESVSVDAEINATKDGIEYASSKPAVYAYVSKAMNLKTYLDGEAPVYSWPGEEGHVTLQNNTAISGDYITVNDDNEGVLLNDASESFYLHVTDKDAVVPSFYISLGTGEGSTAETERMFLFNPVDSVAYPVNMDYDPNYQLSKADTKAIFKAGTMDASRDTLTTTIKGEVRPVAELADNDNTWGGLNRFKFQLIETADLDGTYNVRQTRGSINEDGTPGSETVYLASSSQKLYFTPVKAYALALHIEGVEAPTANEAISATDVKVVAYDGAINIKNAAGKNVVVSTILGQIVANEVLTSDNATISAMIHRMVIRFAYTKIARAPGSACTN